MVNFEWYRTFKAVYETGTLTGAAQVLYASQPGVSLHINSLESYTGYQLFERTSRKMIPTERGKVLYNYIKDAVLKLEDAEQCFRKNSNSDTPTISIGMCMETFQYSIEPYISTLPFDAIIKFVEYKEAVIELEKGVLDLVVSAKKGLEKHFEYKAFSKERIVLIAGSKTPTGTFTNALAANSLSGIQKWLKQQVWYGTTGDMEHLRSFWNANFKKHPDFKCNYIVPNKSSIIRCLRNTNGIAVLPDFLCEEALKDQSVKLLWEGFEPIEQTLYLAKRKGNMYQKQLEYLENLFIEKMPVLAGV
ncbi:MULTISPECIES: LysR family transcriptional regulator [Galbibacter]|uniref:LysR family transcriptional regulator n=1 Tax=Galbibacter pacificus TaxID=2996052 RepID=A0ABT6FRI6_9FLAO|nr:LysR family transcriptional regulator [Galbibacter pacificus]MDG3582996.1 LysR family transcriptional regulator [Galbibacter pacificus]MDG3585885.1 LysR family transcriptional regulator [Galbibacter pacificus]